jgi:hypothetical protein
MEMKYNPKIVKVEKKVLGGGDTCRPKELYTY